MLDEEVPQGERNLGQGFFKGKKLGGGSPEGSKLGEGVTQREVSWGGGSPEGSKLVDGFPQRQSKWGVPWKKEENDVDLPP